MYKILVQVERQAGEVASVLDAAEGFSRLHVAQRGIAARKVLLAFPSRKFLFPLSKSTFYLPK